MLGGIKILRKWHVLWQEMLRVLVYFLGVHTFLRIIFLIVFKESWQSAGFGAATMSLLYGLKMSLKSAGLPVVLLIVLYVVPSVIFPKRNLNRWRDGVIGVWLGVLVFLGYARIPFYQNFGSGFNHLLYQGKDENFLDLFKTLAGSAQFWLLILAAIVTWWGLFYLWKQVERIPYWGLPIFKNQLLQWLLQISIIICLLLLAIFARFGGSLTYSHSFHWENYAVLGNDFLNETILDDPQALYRARKQQELLEEGPQMNLSSEAMRKYAQRLTSSQISDENMTLSSFVRRHAEGAEIQKPRHVFIILGESQGQWPLLPEYEKYHLADGMKNIIADPNSAWIQSFIPNGPFTPMAVTALLTGLVDMKLSPSYQPETYRGAYETGIAPQVRRLGYQTAFWYGGPSRWEDIQKYALSQGFDSFMGMGEMAAEEKANVWGISDRELFRQILEDMDEEKPTVHVILTTSNHAPYSVDLLAEGFPLEAVKSQLPPERQNDEMLLKRLGHYWYADREIAKFVSEVKKRYPESLFIITGDHGARMNIEATSGMFRSVTIPFVVHGAGIGPNLFPKGNAGSQIQIIPTLIELIAPKGFEYYSLAPALTKESREGVSGEYWITGNEIGSRWNSSMDVVSKGEISAKRDIEWEEALLAYSWCRIKRGNNF